MPKRENGLYWVEFSDGEKSIARWDATQWSIIGASAPFWEGEDHAVYPRFHIVRVIAKAVPPE